MIDFTPLLRALLEAGLWGTAINLLMVGRKGASAWPLGVACAVIAGLFGLLMSGPDAGPPYLFERWSLPAAAGSMAGALCAVAVSMADRTKALPRPLGIGWSVVGFYFARLLVRMALALVP